MLTQQASNHSCRVAVVYMERAVNRRMSITLCLKLCLAYATNKTLALLSLKQRIKYTLFALPF